MVCEGPFTIKFGRRAAERRMEHLNEFQYTRDHPSCLSLELLWNQRSHVLVTGSRRCAMSIMGTKVSRSVIGAERWPTDMIGDKLQHEAAKMDLYPVCSLSAWKGCVVRSRALSFIWLDFFCESLGCTRSAAVFPFCWLLFTRFGDVTWKWMTSKWRSRFVFLTHYMECLICG
jgi:hypothetical protein